ncbi:hypothetical protein TNCV_4174011 [Trichonephila clavipes]|nr:hypothetical protein TNCV_4174011 [Trichonephila clavipes]
MTNRLQERGEKKRREERKGERRGKKREERKVKREEEREKKREEEIKKDERREMEGHSLHCSYTPLVFVANDEGTASPLPTHLVQNTERWLRQPLVSHYVILFSVLNALTSSFSGNRGLRDELSSPLLTHLVQNIEG